MYYFRKYLSAMSNIVIIPTYNGETRTDGACPNTYVLTRSWSATDGCGNSSTAIQTINVTDTQAPALVGVPENITASCDAIPAAATVTATDNCDFTLTVIFSENNQVTESCGNIIRTWTATDNCGNSSSATQTITVVDNDAPVLANIPADVTISCDDIVRFNNTVNNAVACCPADASLTLTSNDVTTPGSCPGNYSITRTWTATDDCNNSATASQTINVQDITAPTITCPAAQDFCKAVDNQYTITKLTVYDDNCSDVTIKYSISGATTKSLTVGNDASGIFNVGVSTINWSATDACGNTSSCTQTIIVNALPIAGITNNTGTTVLTCETTFISVTATGGAFYSWSGGLGNNANASITAPGTYTVTVTDANGCTDTETVNITKDESAPIAKAGNDVQINCNTNNQSR